MKLYHTVVMRLNSSVCLLNLVLFAYTGVEIMLYFAVATGVFAYASWCLAESAK